MDQSEDLSVRTVLLERIDDALIVGQLLLHRGSDASGAVRALPHLNLLGIDVEDENHALHLGEDVLLVQEVVLPEHILTVRARASVCMPCAL